MTPNRPEPISVVDAMIILIVGGAFVNGLLRGLMNLHGRARRCSLPITNVGTRREADMMDDTEKALISAIAARRAALRTPGDDRAERLLKVAAITMTAVIAYGALQMIRALV